MTVNTLGTDPRSDRDAVQPGSRTAAGWLWPFLIGGLALFSISALFYYHFHRLELLPQSFLQQMFAGMYDTFGWAPSVVFFLLVFAWSLIWFVTGVLDRPGVRLVRLLVMAVMLGLFLNLGDGGVVWEPHKGAFGAWLGGRLVAAVGYVPSLVLVWITTFSSLLLATDWFFSEWFERPVAKSTGEAGVEDAVTDHLRGLGQDPAAVGPKTPAGDASAETASLEQQAMDLLSKTGLLEAVVEPASVDESTRSSYADRRRLREDREVVEEPAQQSVEGAVSEAGLSSLLGAQAPSSADAELEDGDFVVIAPEHLEAEEVVLGDEDGEASAEDVGVEEDDAEDADLDYEEEEAEEEELDDDAELDYEDAEASSEDAEVEEDAEADAGLDHQEEEAGEEELDDDADEEVELDYEEAEASSEEAEVEEGAEEDADLDYEEEEAEEEELDDDADEEAELDYEEVEASSEEAEVEEGAEEDADLDYEEEEIEEEELDEDADEQGEFDYEEVEASSDDDEFEEGAEEDVDLDYAEEDAGEAEVGDEADEEAERGYEGEVEYEVEAVSEPAYAEVAIPRPEEPVTADSPAQPEVPATGEEQRQQKLFGAGVDEGLVQEAQELLARGRRPTASLLQRKLRIDYELAQDLLQELERRGVVAADGRRG